MNTASCYGKTYFYGQQLVKKQSIYGKTLFNVQGQYAESIYGVTFFFPERIYGIDGERLTYCELYIITCADGTVVRFCSDNQLQIVDSYPFPPLPVRRSPFRFHPDLQVDRCSISLGIVGVMIGNKQYSLPQIIRRDWLRQAEVKIYAYNWDTQEVPDWDRPRYLGFVSGDIGFTKGTIELNVGSLLDRLNDKFPKLIYTEQCNHILFDTYCGLDADDYKESDVIVSGSTPKIIYADIFLFSNHAQGWWERGEIKITDSDAANYNVSRMIIQHGDGWVKVIFPFPDNISAGETFDAWPGCDLTGVTCDEKFQNYSAFFGFEYIPKPDTLFSPL